MNDFSNINGIVNYLEEIAPTKFDITLPMSQLNAAPFFIGNDEDRKSVIGLDAASPMERLLNGGSQPLPMSRNAFRGLFYRMGLAKGWAFMRDNVSPNHAQKGAALLNDMLHDEEFNTNKRGEKLVYVRSRSTIQDVEDPDDDNDGDAFHRAVFSQDYVTLDMLQVGRVVQDAANQFNTIVNTDELMRLMRQQYGVGVEIANPDGGSGIGHKIERAKITPDSMSFRLRLNMRFHTEELGNFHTGLFVRTDEIGGTSIHILPYIWRQVCKNGMIGSYERKEVTQMRREQSWAPIIPHRWGDTEDLTYQATKATAFALAYGTNLVKQARAAAYREIPSATGILSSMLEAMVPKDLLQETTLRAGAGMEGEHSFMGVVNGITAAAHTDGLSQDTIDELEAAGGTALRQFSNDSTDDEIARLFLGLAKAELIQIDDQA